MGIALIIPGISFSGANLGTVTPASGGDITALAISGPDTVIGAEDAASFTPIYTPSDTPQRSVTWSIISGVNYASINSATGVLSVISGSSSPVTIRCRSLINQSVYADKAIRVTYAGAFTPLEDLTARINFPYNSGNGGYYKTDIIPSNSDYIKVKFTRFGTNRLAFYCGSRQLSNADTDSFTVEKNASSNLVVKVGGKIFTSANTIVSDTPYVVIAKSTGVQVTPSLGTFTEGTYTFSSGHPLVIGAIGYADGQVGYNSGPGDIYGIEIYGSDNTLKHRLIPQSDLTFKDEITGATYQKTGGGSVAYADN